MTATAEGGEGAPGSRGRLAESPASTSYTFQVSQSRAIAPFRPPAPLPHLKATLTQHRPCPIVVAPVSLDPVQELPWDVALDPDLGWGGRAMARLMASAPEHRARTPPLPRHPLRLPPSRPPISRCCLVPFLPHPLVELGPLDVVDGLFDLICPCRPGLALLNPHLHPPPPQPTHPGSSAPGPRLCRTKGSRGLASWP